MTCHKCMGTKKLIVGALLLLNAYVWPLWTGIDGWITWFAVLMVAGGALMLAVPNKCRSCHAGHTDAKPAAKKKKRR